jgi:DNA invertase Pin-like site-specific DNA recombinase
MAKPTLSVPGSDPDALCISYLRFSSAEQAGGDSTRRQGDAAALWCKRHGLKLDDKLSLRDLGSSAYSPSEGVVGEHRSDEHDLGQFLALVKRGLVKRGSWFIIENLDRLSRESERTAIRLWLDILDAGVNIVQLNPETIFRHESSDMFDIMRAVMELGRGHQESALKSERIGEAWAQKKARARATGQVATRRLPGWVEEVKGSLVLIPERAAVVRRIFAMAASGYGLSSIVATLTADGVPAFGDRVPALDGDGRQRRTRRGKPCHSRGEAARFGAGHWVKSQVARILSDRRALGDYQPRRRVKGGGRPADGEAIKGYFPAAVTEEEFLAARAGAAERKLKAGRVNRERPNVFSGLLRNAREGDSYTVALRIEKGGRRHHVLVNGNSTEGRAPCFSFPFDTLEAAVLSCLREIDPHDILNGDSGPDEALALAGQLAGVETELTEAATFMEAHGFSPTIGKRIASLEALKRDLAARLAEARQKALHPLSETWGEARSLIGALAEAEDPADARLRLRSALRRIVDSIWLLVVPRGRDRLCAVQVWFAGGNRRRDYLILNRSPRGNAHGTIPGGWTAHSLAGDAAAGDLDLRQPAHAERLEERLEALDLSTL